MNIFLFVFLAAVIASVVFMSLGAVLYNSFPSNQPLLPQYHNQIKVQPTIQRPRPVYTNSRQFRLHSTLPPIDEKKPF
jgi:predicted membrane channel-forming protein YqfA (hemolysin III family)